MKRKVVLQTLHRILPVAGCVILVMAYAGCPQFTAPPWPTNYAPILTDQYVDAVGDEVSPLGVGTYPSIDVTDVALGVDNDYLYIRVDFAVPIPTVHQDVSGVWPFPSEYVKDQGFRLNLNVDGQFGGDVLFTCKLRYGEGYVLYVLSVEVPANLDPLVGVGELGEGGSGYDYLIVRFDVSELGSLFPRGTAVTAGLDASADSVDADDNMADSAWDNVSVGVWNIPN
jgi:hypothetical protein